MTMFIGQLDALMPDWQGSILESEWSVRAGRLDFSHRRRENKQFASRNRFASLWPSSRILSGDPSTPMSGVVNDLVDRWSPYQRAARGSQSLKYIMGKCIDSTGAAVPSATVEGYLTSNDQPVRKTTADSSGNYELGTEYPATNHYLVAYKPGSPDIFGTTVNTLQAANRDGT